MYEYVNIMRNTLYSRIVFTLACPSSLQVIRLAYFYKKP